jgi:hypothetical protein
LESCTVFERLGQYNPAQVLWQHEIATLQTTVGQDIQTVSLTTMLAHASGEWIASAGRTGRTCKTNPFEIAAIPWARMRKP